MTFEIIYERYRDRYQSNNYKKYRENNKSRTIIEYIQND